MVSLPVRASEEFMKAAPPTPELCGSTSDSIAWTAIAASTALPPRLRTFRPARAASGLAAITNGSEAWLAPTDRAGAGAQDVKPARAKTQSSLGNKRIACAYHDKW